MPVGREPGKGFPEAGGCGREAWPPSPRPFSPPQASSSPGRTPATSSTCSWCTRRCFRSSSRNAPLARPGTLPSNSLTLALTRFWALPPHLTPTTLCSAPGCLSSPEAMNKHTSPSPAGWGWHPWGSVVCELCSHSWLASCVYAPHVHLLTASPTASSRSPLLLPQGCAFWGRCHPLGTVALPHAHRAGG